MSLLNEPYSLYIAAVFSPILQSYFGNLLPKSSRQVTLDTLPLARTPYRSGAFTNLAPSPHPPRWNSAPSTPVATALPLDRRHPNVRARFARAPTVYSLAVAKHLLPIIPYRRLVTLRHLPRNLDPFNIFVVPVITRVSVVQQMLVTQVLLAVLHIPFLPVFGWLSVS